MKRGITLLIVLLVSAINVRADELPAKIRPDFEVDNISYKILSTEDKTVAVSCRETSFWCGYIDVRYDNRLYEGDLVIPSTVTFEDTEFTVTGIYDHAFDDCEGLTSVAIPKTVTWIGGWAFRACLRLLSVNIPESVTSIGENAFAYCNELTILTLPEGITDIGVGAFSDCSRLTSINIPQSLTTISKQMLAYCTSLAAISIPDNVTAIGQEAFLHCHSLASLHIPESVTTIGNQAFAHCSGLKEINFPAGVQNEADMGEACYAYCNSALKLTIPESVSRIPNKSFMFCHSLLSITIPVSINSLGSKAFEYCSGIQYVMAKNDVPAKILDDTFWNYNIPLYLPDGATQYYRNAAGWKNFKIVIEGEPASIYTPTKESHTNGKTYLLNGRQAVSPSQPGIYIRNGKKFIVR